MRRGKPSNEQFAMIPRDVLRSEDLSLTAKVVYGVVALYAWGHNPCKVGWEKIAEDCGLGRTATMNALKELVDRDWIRVERRKVRRGHANVYFLTQDWQIEDPKDRSRKADAVTTASGLADEVADEVADAVKPDLSYAGADGSQTKPDETSSSITSSSTELDLSEDVPQDMRSDAAELLASKTKVGARRVSPREMGTATAALAEYNRQAGANFGIGGQLASIVSRIRERPSMPAEQHIRLVQSAWRLRWWERNGNGRRPSPGVIYGKSTVFEEVIQDAVDEANGVPIRTAAPSNGVVYHDRYSDKRQREIEREEAAQRVLAAQRLRESQ